MIPVKLARYVPSLVAMDTVTVTHIMMQGMYPARLKPSVDRVVRLTMGTM